MDFFVWKLNSNFGSDALITYSPGTVFNSGAQVLVNTVNCYGVMGAGIALEFKLRYPRMFENYVEQCKNQDIRVGEISLYRDFKIEVLQFPTKRHWRYPSKLAWIDLGLRHFVSMYKQLKIRSVAFPKLGTSNGGLDWQDVRQIMIERLSNLPDLDVVICLDELVDAEGVEKQMLEALHVVPLTELKKKFKLSEKQIKGLTENLPLRRFRYLGSIEGFRLSTYERLYKYFYQLVTGEQEQFLF
jgi:O-acetyl-ADP-ribose deacetylase (regulator of RNase III)